MDRRYSTGHHDGLQGHSAKPPLIVGRRSYMSGFNAGKAQRASLTR